MKRISLILIFFLIIGIYTTSNASSNVTYFDGQAVIIEDANNSIEILSNEVLINTSMSKINNQIILNNNSNKEQYITIKIPLENHEISTSIHDLEININNQKVKYKEGQNGLYIIETKFLPNTGKKIDITYYTDNDLRDAKVIKYNMDNFKGKKIGKVKVDILIDEKDIPLVKGVYPPHYTFDQNVISVEYYGMTPNTLTKDVIVDKETYKNLKYGREYELSEYDKKLINNIDNLLENGIKFEYRESYYSYMYEYLNIPKIIDEYGNEHFDYNEVDKISKISRNIFEFLFFKQVVNDEKYDLVNIYTENTFCLYKDVLEKLDIDLYLMEHQKEWYKLFGKKVCIDYVETVDVEPLYVNINKGRRT